MIGETVPDPDLELRSVVRSTQDPENEVGVSDIITAGWGNEVENYVWLARVSEVHLGSVQLHCKQ